jgi:hypothetical protein
MKVKKHNQNKEKKIKLGFKKYKLKESKQMVVKSVSIIMNHEEKIMQ